MTTQEKIEEIRKACVVANPAIMELAFGCEIIGPFGKAIVLAEAKKNNENIEGERKILGERYSVLRGRTASFYNHIAIKEILGRPIRLADVLLALARIQPNPSLELYSIQVSIVGVGNDALWFLPKDDIRDQSPEFIDFLYQLLK